jgi:predicted porin
MKKSLFALAALGAFAGAAQAQSSVTLFGTMDASVNYISNGGVDKSGTTANSSIANGTSTPAAGSCAICVVDGAIATSMWGFKGTEDLGGGTRAEFYAAGDLQINNGNINTAGPFRRGAYVLLGSNSAGSVSLGLRSNPVTDGFATTMPVMGNTVTQVRNVIGFASGDFIKNQISYETPTWSGFKARAAYGASNEIADTTGGSILAAAASYTNSGFTLIAGYNKANAVSISQQGGDPAAATGTKAYAPLENASASAAWASMYDQVGYFAGLKYSMGAFSIGYAFAHGELTVNSTGAPASATAGPGGNVAGKIANANVNMIGLGYQATPTLLLGLNYMITTADSTFTNLQARYSLSKRTTAYFQGSLAKNGSGAGSDGSAFGNFMPTNTNSSTFIKNVGGYGLVSGSSYGGGLPNTNSTALGVGVIHNF